MRSVARRLGQVLSGGPCSTSTSAASESLHTLTPQISHCGSRLGAIRTAALVDRKQLHEQPLAVWRPRQLWDTDSQCCTSIRLYSSLPPTPPATSAASDRVKELADLITQLTVLECSQLTELVRSKLNIQRPAFPAGMSMMAATGPAPAAGAGPAAAGTGAAKPEVKKEKTEFDIKLESFSPESKIKVIKEVRTITALGLKEAKELVEKSPIVIKSSVVKADADAIKKQLETAGAKVALV